MSEHLGAHSPRKSGYWPAVAGVLHHSGGNMPTLPASQIGTRNLRAFTVIHHSGTNLLVLPTAQSHRRNQPPRRGTR